MRLCSCGSRRIESRRLEEIGPSFLAVGGSRSASASIVAQKVTSPQNCDSVFAASTDEKIRLGVSHPAQIRRQGEFNEKPRRSPSMKAKNFDRKFERGEEVTEPLDLARAKRASRATQRVNVDFPLWMIQSLDREASRLGFTRQSIIKIWLAERLDSSAERNPPPAEPLQIP
jgi:hypothetical protein